MASKKILKTKDIERLENTTGITVPSAISYDCLTTATTFCCPTQGGLCDIVYVQDPRDIIGNLPTQQCLTTATTFCCGTGSIS